jgi:hypothetical protein
VAEGGAGSFEIQSDAFVACQYCCQFMCEACLMPASVQVTIPLISVLGLTWTISLHHAGATCRDYFYKVQHARHRARSSAANAQMQLSDSSSNALRIMLASSGAKECPSCRLPGTHARAHHCHHINCDACGVKYVHPEQLQPA